MCRIDLIFHTNSEQIRIFGIFFRFIIHIIADYFPYSFII